MTRALDAQDKKWQRENDAHTLAEAEAIKADKGRLSGAKKEAKIMVKETTKRQLAMKKVASGKVTSTVRKNTAKPAARKPASKKPATRSKKK